MLAISRHFTKTRALIACNVILMGIVFAQFCIPQYAPRGASPADLADRALALAAPGVQAQTTLAASPAGGVLQSLAPAAQKISPSIVSVGAVRLVRERAWMRDFFSPFYMPYSIERKAKIPYLGSGIIIGKDGLVLTNQHVVEEAEDLFVTLNDGRELNAKLLDADKVLDVAVLKIALSDCQVAEIGDSDKLLTCDWVLAVGNPFGNLIGDPHPTVTHGVISALKRSFSPEQGRTRVYPNMIQTDAAINPGNSGGALVDAMGRVVGINTFIFSASGGGSNGIGFAIPINRAMRVVREIQKFGHIRNLYADFEVVDLSRDLVRQLGLKSGHGAYVRGIEKNGPSARAGLHAGDLILAVDGQACESAESFWMLYAAHYVGDKSNMTVLRNGKTFNIEYMISEGK
ncbi:MAG: trypsin-like peptidase domain-containing protein [Candidatus Sumerlaeota bacterium]|nr:trypsin-like peptidase domain-containing protein [Candidatus Sumerlaeota bacterium]